MAAFHKALLIGHFCWELTSGKLSFVKNTWYLTVSLDSDGSSFCYIWLYKCLYCFKSFDYSLVISNFVTETLFDMIYEWALTGQKSHRRRLSLAPSRSGNTLRSSTSKTSRPSCRARSAARSFRARSSWPNTSSSATSLKWVKVLKCHLAILLYPLFKSSFL